MSDTQNTVPEEEGSGAVPGVAEKPKRSRRVLVLLVIVFILALVAIGGVITAVSVTHEDPAAIKLPTDTVKNLAIDEIVQQSVPVDPETAPEAEEQQKEAPLELKSQTPIPEKKPLTDEPKEEVAPQSMIIWDEPVATAANNQTPRIVIVIDDMGLNMRNSRTVAELKAPITLAYLPYAQNLPQQTKTAFDNGHELIVHMPMEPDDIAHNNPGPNALLSTASAQENLERLNKNLGQFDHYIGLNNHMGSKMTASEKAMRPVLQAVKEKGLWFLDSRTIGNSVAGKIASELKIPYVARDVFLDNVENVQTILAQLKQTEMIASKRGYAVAIGHPHNATIEALKLWLPQVQQKGFVIVPLSTIIAQRYPAAPMPRYARLKKTSETDQHIAVK